MSKPTLDLARAKRAATERMTVRDTGRANFYYVSSKRGVYLVNTGQNTYTCADFRKRILRLRRKGNLEARCKHQLRVIHATQGLRAQQLYAPRPRTEWKEAV